MTARNGAVSRGRRTRSTAPAAQKPAVGYVRVSTEEQATMGVSLDAQRAKIGDYCRLHDLELVEILADEGRSAKRADNRPGLSEALDVACRANGALVVYSLSRLARSTRDAIDIAERLDRAGADLVSICEKIDTTTSIGRFFFTTIAALAQLERDQISERTTAALAHKRSQRQRVSGRIPYGFTLHRDGVRLLENAAELRVIRRVRLLRARGFSSRQIIERLERAGLAPKGGGRWHPKVVLEMCGRAGTPVDGPMA